MDAQGNDACDAYRDPRYAPPTHRPERYEIVRDRPPSAIWFEIQTADAALGALRPHLLPRQRCRTGPKTRQSFLQDRSLDRS